MQNRKHIFSYLTIIIFALMILTSCMSSSNYINSIINFTNEEKEGSGTTDIKGVDIAMDLDTYVTEAISNVKALGLLESDEVLTKQLLSNFQEMPEEILESMDATQIYGMIFDYIGSGKYNYDTWDWTPSSDRIYSFDTEVFNTGKIYTFFLRGISAITANEIKIENIVEDTSQVDYESGTGKQIISFQCNGKQYQYEANVYYDWFDTEMLTYMKKVIEEQETGKHLWVTSDGYQNCIVFYETEEWANDFSSYTGYSLE